MAGRPPPKRRKRRRWPWAIASLLVLAATAFGAWQFYLRAEDSAARLDGSDLEDAALLPEDMGDGWGETSRDVTVATHAGLRTDASNEFDCADSGELTATEADLVRQHGRAQLSQVLEDQAGGSVSLELAAFDDDPSAVAMAGIFSGPIITECMRTGILQELAADGITATAELVDRPTSVLGGLARTLVVHTPDTDLSLHILVAAEGRGVVVLVALGGQTGFTPESVDALATTVLERLRLSPAAAA